MKTLDDFATQAIEKLQAENEAKIREFLIAHGWDGKDMEQAKEIASEYEVHMTQDGYIFDIRSKPVAEEEPKTNADRIRQMTDKQLAEFLASLMPQFCASCRLMDPDFIPMLSCMGKGCEDSWLDWLKDYDRHFWKRREPLKADENILEEGE